MKNTKDGIRKAVSTALKLNGEIRAAHKAACAESELAELLLRDLLADVVKLQNRLAQIESCMP